MWHGVIFMVHDELKFKCLLKVWHTSLKLAICHYINTYTNTRYKLYSHPNVVIPVIPWQNPYRIDIPNFGNRETWIQSPPIILLFERRLVGTRWCDTIIWTPPARLQDCARLYARWCGYNPDIWYLGVGIYCVLKAVTTGMTLWTWEYHQASSISSTLLGNKIGDHADVGDRRCSNYIFILDLTPGFNGLGKGKCKRGRETFTFWDLVQFILEVWR